VTAPTATGQAEAGREPARWRVLPRGRPADSGSLKSRRLLRRLIPASILLPIAGGLLRWEGEQEGLFGAGVGLTLMVTFMVVGMSLLVLWISRQVARNERTRHEAEQALIDERLLLDVVLEASGAHIYFKDTEHRYVGMSPSMARHHGLADVTEAIGKSDADFFSYEQAQKALEDEERLLTAGIPVLSEEERETWPDGSERWVETTKLPVRDPEGAIIGLVGVSWDVTARKRAEERLMLYDAQKLESLSALAGGVAHDFNNLLVCVLGNASIALSELPEGSPARSTVHEILTAGERMAKLAREMLVYSGRGRFVLQPLDLSATAGEVARLLSAIVPTDVRLSLERLGRNLPPVNGDEAQIRQVIAAMITNAVEAIGDTPGTVTIHTDTVHAERHYLRDFKPHGLPEGDYVAVAVADTGPGIDRELLDRIFEPFFTTKFTGRGLGLAALLGIVRGHSGGVMVESEVGRGSTFTVLLPAVSSPRDLGDEGGRWAGTSRHGTVLIADDDSIVRSVTAAMLERAGFSVLIAKDGAEAFELFRTRSSEIVAVVLDLVMPGKSGEEVLTDIHKLRTDVPVLLCSGYSEHDQNGGQLGVNGMVGFIAKPYTADVLVGKLQEMLARALR
jgi:PAS domain S-box-containing protein